MVHITEHANQSLSRLRLPVAIAPQLGRTVLSATRSTVIRTWSILVVMGYNKAKYKRSP